MCRINLNAPVIISGVEHCLISGFVQSIAGKRIKPEDHRQRAAIQADGEDTG